MVGTVILFIEALIFTALGVFSIKRKEPMWFWSGSTVEKTEIKDIPAYNKANGIMWIVYSLFFWTSAIMSIFDMKYSYVPMILGVTLGIVLLIIAYRKIYNKYKA